MLKKSASREKVEVQAKIEAQMSTSDLHSTSTYLLATAALGIRRVSARLDWTGEKSGHFEHPASRSTAAC
jgi:hypothetical protein